MYIVDVCQNCCLRISFTLGFESSCHCGVRKKRMPFDAPSSVTARINSAIMTTYGNNARKYEHLPELLTPREMIKNTITHAPSKHNVKRQLGKPIRFNHNNLLTKFPSIDAKI